MVTLSLIVHFICCIILILAILLQSGKSPDLAGAFGGMGSQTTFGPRGGATLLSRVTTAAAVIFMITSLGLTVMMAGGGSNSKMKGLSGSAGGVGRAQQPIPTKTAPTAPSKGVPPSQAKPATSLPFDLKDQKGRAVEATTTVIPLDGLPATPAQGKPVPPPPSQKPKAE